MCVYLFTTISNTFHTLYKTTMTQYIGTMCKHHCDVLKKRFVVTR